MGKKRAAKTGTSTKFQTSSGNISKHATAEQVDVEPANAKERIQHELGLLHTRGKALPDNPINKVKKKTTMKRTANARQQKKIARALMVADKEEAKIEKHTDKLEKKKLRKMVWS